MTSKFDLSSELHSFTGTAPLFPLPNVVLFPHVMLPLHIFEPRYRQMTADALEGDRFIAMALLNSPSAALEQNPPIHSRVCLGKIIAEEKLDDGRYYLVVKGICRATVVEELHLPFPYRIARLDLNRDDLSTEVAPELQTGLHEMLLRFQASNLSNELKTMFHHALDESVPSAVLVDVLSYAMGLEPELAQELLNETDVPRRIRLLLRLLKHHRSPGDEFPPPFSLN